MHALHGHLGHQWFSGRDGGGVGEVSWYSVCRDDDGDERCVELCDVCRSGDDFGRRCSGKGCDSAGGEKGGMMEQGLTVHRLALVFAA